MTTKICRQCNQEKTTDDFYKMNDYIRSYCKLCSGLKGKQYYLKNKQKQKTASKAWRDKNLDYAREQSKLYYVLHKEQIKQRKAIWYQNTKAKQIDFQRKQRRDNNQ